MEKDFSKMSDSALRAYLVSSVKPLISLPPEIFAEMCKSLHACAGIEKEALGQWAAAIVEKRKVKVAPGIGEIKAEEIRELSDLALANARNQTNVDKALLAIGALGSEEITVRAVKNKIYQALSQIVIVEQILIKFENDGLCTKTKHETERSKHIASHYSLTEKGFERLRRAIGNNIIQDKQQQR